MKQLLFKRKIIDHGNMNEWSGMNDKIYILMKIKQHGVQTTFVYEQDILLFETFKIFYVFFVI